MVKDGRLWMGRDEIIPTAVRQRVYGMELHRSGTRRFKEPAQVYKVAILLRSLVKGALVGSEQISY